MSASTAMLADKVWKETAMLDQPHAKPNGAKPQQEMISGAFLRNAWYVAAWSDELGDGKLVARTLMNEPVVLFRKNTWRSQRSKTAAPTASRRSPWARSSAATASSARIMGWNSTAAAPACTTRTAPKTFRPAPE